MTRDQIEHAARLLIPADVAEHFGKPSLRHKQGDKEMTTTVLFDTNKWIVSTRAPKAYGPFEDCHAAYQFDARRGGDGSIVTTWHEPEWVNEHFPPDWGAIWFNGDWANPFVVGPFYDVADAVQTYGSAVGTGIAVALEEVLEEEDAFSPDIGAAIEAAIIDGINELYDK